MEKIQFKSLSTESRNELRKQVLGMKKKGISQKEIAGILGVHESTVSRWMARYKTAGSRGLTENVRGRKHGEKRWLTAQQEREVRKQMVDKHPEQLKLPYVLWTRSAVRDLIVTLYGMELPIRTVGEYLSRWGFTPQKPVRLAYEQQPAAIRKWLDEEYPVIRARAKAEGAEIHWGDETGVNTETYVTRGYSPSGQKPTVSYTGRRFSVGMVSSITNEGQVRYMFFEKAMNTDLFIQFLERLTQSVSRKIHLILDNLKVHHANKVKGWVESHADRIELHFLPAYAPEYNPDEYLNQDLKKKISVLPRARTPEQLANHVSGHLESLKDNPAKVRSFFRHKKTLYAGI